MSAKLRAPVAFLVFNRPETTEKVFAAIAQVKPSKLLVVADGPRSDRKDDAAGCAAVRAIIERVDWDCDVVKHYSETNLGCRKRVSSGLDWVFKNTEEAIILEDDCLPHPTFFSYCDELLEKYRDDERIMHIGGVNMQAGKVHGDGSYYFSKYNPIWGWASWRRAWKHYDVAMKTFPEFERQNQIANLVSDSRIQKSWMTNFRAVYEGKIDTWDFQWTYATWTQGGLSVIPNVNLITNLGFGENSVHTSDKKNPFANMPTQPIGPLTHPRFILKSEAADHYVDKTFVVAPFAQRVRNKLERVFQK